MSMYEIAIPYHRQTVATKIAKGFDQFANVSTSSTVLLNHLRKLLGNKVLVTFSRSDAVDPNTVNLNAYYDPDEDEENEKPFEVVVIFNTNDKRIKMNREDWREFAAQVIDYMQHEMVHQYQYRKRNFQPTRVFKSKAKDPAKNAQQTYLGNPDEIEAYAYNLASELDRKTGGDYERQMRLLRNFSSTAITRDQAGRFLSPNLYGYFKEFDFDTSHPVLKALMKKTYQYVVMKKKKEEKTKRVADRNLDIQTREKLAKERMEALDKDKTTTYNVIVEQ